VGSLITSRWPMTFPLSTFVINITGSFIIGFFLAFAGAHPAINPHWRLLIAVGFVGAYTTFSTFEYEILNLIEAGLVMNATLYFILSAVVGFVAVRLGVMTERYFFSS
jgi:CrcB protein